MAESTLVRRAADELYGLPPGEFTSARDGRAKELRKEGEREAADAVKGLRKPTVAAWALNQLARRRPKDLERLLSAGEELRAAQDELLAGGERSAFQEAASRERELVAQLSADAATLASEAGQRGGGLQEKLAGTLHAAALDEETAEELRAGRLTRERDAIGGFGEMAAAPPGRAARPARGNDSAPRTAGGRGAARGKAAPKGSRSTDTAKRSRAKGAASGRAADDARRRQRLAAARTDERHAQRELDAATRTLEHAQERAAAAQAHAAEAAERARTTAERLKEARRAEAAARTAHTRASRALESAEGKS
jgi:hypothetical protein